jgi:hypothetical protein
MNQSLQTTLKKLRLSGMAESLEVRLQEAAGNRLTHGEFLELALQDEVLAKYLMPDLLIIDDMGIKQLPKRSGEYLFEIIMRRYETKSTIMTSNRPLEDWGKLIGDVPSATAILDRFLHHAEIITITGRSYRLKDRTATENKDKNPSVNNGSNKNDEQKSN